MVPVHAADCKNIITKAKKKKHTLDLRLETCGVVLKFFIYYIQVRIVCDEKESRNYRSLRRNCWVNSVHCFMIITV